MAFDEDLAAQVPRLVAKRKGLSEKRMFDGLAFLLNGNMSCGIHRCDLNVRMDPAAAASPLMDEYDWNTANRRWGLFGDSL